MSEVRRFSLLSFSEACEAGKVGAIDDSKGWLVLYEDYANLQQKLNALAAENAALKEARPAPAVNLAEMVPEDIYAELYRLREEIKGPNGKTWKDLAVRMKAAMCKQIDYLEAMSAYHSSEWHKMDPITGYMRGFNAHTAMLSKIEEAK